MEMFDGDDFGDGLIDPADLDDEDPPEIHNCWTIYGMDDATTEAANKLASAGTRPQDWGDPRWHYERVTVETPFLVHHVHCWTDLKRKPEEYRALFAPLVAMVMRPGRPEQLCGRDYLSEDDFWLRKWGKKPPIWEDEHDGWEEFGP